MSSSCRGRRLGSRSRRRGWGRRCFGILPVLFLNVSNPKEFNQTFVAYHTILYHGHEMGKERERESRKDGKVGRKGKQKQKQK